MTTQTTHHRFAGNVARLLVLLTGLGLLTALVIDQRLWERFLPADPGFGIVVDGRDLRVDAVAAEALAKQSAGRARLGSARADAMVQDLVAAELDALFDDLAARVPDYADWYFSLKGEYARLSMLIMQRTGLLGGDYLAERAVDLIFGGDALGDRLAGIEERAGTMLGVHAREQRAAWLAELLHLTEGRTLAESERAPVAVLVLDDLAAEFGGHGSSEFLARLSASSAGAGAAGIAAPLLARLALRPAAAAAAGTALAAKSAGRGAARAGTAGASALGCAVAGPAALPCAVVVGGTAWVAADWALLSVDEWRHREALIADWEQRLTTLRAELEEALIEHYAQAIEAWRKGMETEVERTFSPLHAIRTTGPVGLRPLG